MLDMRNGCLRVKWDEEEGIWCGLGKEVKWGPFQVEKTRTQRCDGIHCVQLQLPTVELLKR